MAQGNSTVDSDDNTDRVSAAVECPAGYRVVGGGAGLSFGFGNTTWFTVSSAPVEAGAGVFEEDGWTATFQTSDGEDAEGQYGFRARAICALTP